MVDFQQTPVQSLELGRLLANSGDFKSATPHLREAETLFYENRMFSEYLKTQNILLRIYAEMGLRDEACALTDKLKGLVFNNVFELNSKTYYTLAICASYDGQHDVSLDYLQKSLNSAMAHDNKEDICHALIGLAICYNRLDKKTESLKILSNLQILLEGLDLPEIKISSMILNSKILADLEKFEQATQIIWQAFDLLRQRKIMTMYIYLLHNMGAIYLAAGEREMALVYLTLAQKSIDPENMVVLSKLIEKDIIKAGSEHRLNYDLVFEVDSHSVVEKTLGRVSFRNQFILIDLLNLFLKNRGSVYSKEYLAETIWKEPYDPRTHDNKIYVTIKRLRTMIEPDYSRPRYIFRAKNGYFLNSSARVFIG